MPLKDLPVERIVSHIISNEITVEEVVEYYLERINKFNHSLNAIVSLKNEEKIKVEALANGMTPLRDAGIDKIEDGVTTIQEIIRSTVQE